MAFDIPSPGDHRLRPTEKSVLELPGEQAVNHALGRFRPGERPVIEEAIDRAVQAVVVWATRGADDCMNQYNG